VERAGGLDALLSNVLMGNNGLSAPTDSAGSSLESLPQTSRRGFLTGLRGRSALTGLRPRHTGDYYPRTVPRITRVVSSVSPSPRTDTRTSDTLYLRTSLAAAAISASALAPFMRTSSPPSRSRG